MGITLDIETKGLNSHPIIWLKIRLTDSIASRSSVSIQAFGLNRFCLKLNGLIEIGLS